MDNFTKNIENVISMTQHQSNAGYSPLAQVRAYWDALRNGRLMPNRTEIDPRGLQNALEYSFIVERIAPGVARVRVAGSHLGDLTGTEVRGMPLGSLLNSASRRQISDTLEEVFETPAEATLYLSTPKTLSKPALEARLLLLPLKSDLGDVSRILGAIVARGDLSSAPRRFDIDRIDLQPILTPAAAQTPAETPAHTSGQTPGQTASAPVAGFAETAARFVNRPKNVSPSVPYLRLVKDDREQAGQE